MDNVSSALVSGHSVESSFDNRVKGLIRAAEAKIACLESQIRDLQRLRDQERELVTALKPLIAPIRSLPSELLLEAFHMTMDSVFPWDLSWLEQVLAISGVCVHWRKLVCTTPQFWERRLELKVNLTKASPDSYLSTAKTFFERSAPLAIPISLSDVSETSPLVRYIFSIASRWKSFNLYDSQIDSLLREIPEDALQCLESVGIYRDTDSLSPLPITVFLSARRLRIVTLHGHSMHQFHMPWSQLTDFTLMDSSESAQNCLDVLAQCANVVIARLTGLLPWATPPAPVASAQIIELVHLKMLEMAVAPSEEIHFTPFFARLALPALRRLTIGAGSNTTWSSSDFTPFQRRSPKIEQLEITGPRLTSENFASLLIESPSLTKLRLGQCFQDAAAVHSVLSCLQYSDTQTVHLVPRLQQLQITCFGFRLDEPILERTILSRWWTDAYLLQLLVPPPVARWKMLEIYNHNGDEDDYYEVYSESFQAKMAQAREEGLWLVLDSDTMLLPPT